jgi:hypothetical protein
VPAKVVYDHPYPAIGFTQPESKPSELKKVDYGRQVSEVRSQASGTKAGQIQRGCHQEAASRRREAGDRQEIAADRGVSTWRPGLARTFFRAPAKHPIRFHLAKRPPPLHAAGKRLLKLREKARGCRH